MNYSSKAFYKVRWQLLQSATAFFIRKCDNLLLQSATAILLQSLTSVITKCVFCHAITREYLIVCTVTLTVAC